MAFDEDTGELISTKTPSTPWVVLHWGDLRGFQAVVTNVGAKYTLFTPGGTPIRAVCAVTLEEMPSDVAKQNPTSGALVVRDGKGFVPQGQTVLRHGDQLLVVSTAEVRRKAEERIRAVDQEGRLAGWT